MKIAIVRGSYFNKFEMQNYESLSQRHKITGFSGLKPIHQKYSFPLVKLASPVDLPNFPFKMPVLNRLCLGDAMYLFGLEEKLKGFDLVHTRETYFHFTQQALNAKKRGWVKKVVCTCSETIPFNHEGIWNRRRFKQRAIKEVDFFHCLTEKAKDCLIKEGGNPKKIVVFPYGVDLKKFKIKDTKHAKTRRNPSIFRILFVGRLVKEKGIYDLLKIFISLYKSNKNIRLNIVGDGPERPNIINLINQIRLKYPQMPVNVVKIKKAPYSKVYKEYQKANIFCLLSRPTQYWEEYLGMVLIEAMVSGLPIVTTKCGAIPEVVGRTGLLVNPGDWQAGLKAVNKLLKNKKLRIKLSLEGRKRAKKYFDGQKVSQNIEKLWLK